MATIAASMINTAPMGAITRMNRRRQEPRLSSSQKVIIAALIGNGLIAVTKFVAAAATGSSAMLSEGIHSIVDTGNQILLLYCLRRSQKPADDDFPFGYGKEIYFWSFVVAILIFAIGAGVSVYEGIHRLTEPTSMLGLLVALFGIMLVQLTGIPYFDGIASILIGVILGATAIWLAYETKGLLIGESANQPVVKGIRGIVRESPHIHHVNEILTMHMGPEFVLVNISADFMDTADASAIEATIAVMDERIKARFPNVKRVFVEAESRRATRSEGGAAAVSED